jgi:diacylglycerol kinase
MIFGKTWQSFLCAVNGIKTVWREEKNFRLETIIAVAVAVAAFYFKFSFTESFMVAAAIIIVLGAEIINTAIEDLCNEMEPDEDKTIGKIKDVAAAYVLLSALGAAIIGAVVLIHHFYF